MGSGYPPGYCVAAGHPAGVLTQWPTHPKTVPTPSLAHSAHSIEELELHPWPMRPRDQFE